VSANGGSTVSASRSLRLSGHALLLIAAAPILLFLLLPSLIIVPMALSKSQMIQFPPEWISLHSFADYLGDPQWVDSTLLSFQVTIVAVLIAAVTGGTAAIALHGRSFAGKGLLVGLIMMPIVTPVVILALGDYLLFAQLRVLGSWVPIAIAHGVLATPYVFISAQTSLTSELNPALVRSARSLGARPISVLYHVYWPAVRPGVLAGSMLGFAVSFDEVVLALFLQGANSVTLPVRTFSAIQYELTPKIAASASLFIVLALVALALQAFAARKTGRLS
jgi:putative spermidine/putrescine transport system permease protein